MQAGAAGFLPPYPGVGLLPMVYAIGLAFRRTLPGPVPGPDDYAPSGTWIACAGGSFAVNNGLDFNQVIGNAKRAAS